MKNKASYIIGIDLGTTNCTLAYTPIQAEGHAVPSITQAELPQIIGANTQGAPLSLPSFIYYPLEEELSARVAAIEWDLSRPYAIGAFARDRGSELPARLVASAKSWLCHTGIDRRQAILPFESEEIASKISPLEACSEILRHLREAWDFNKSEAPFVDQHILITVPASFDPNARQLVQEAAEKAGYPEIVLLEEPQAAFYAWLHAHAKNWREVLKVGDCVLVVDIGGGTTDFSLIGVEEIEGNLTLKRLAVGSHLLLGGDNIDLGLAYLAKQKLEEQGHLIDAWQLQALVHQCRQAKEMLMGEKPPAKIDITVLGRGSKLIGNTLKTELTQKEAHQFVLDGFIPLIGPDERSPVERRTGIQQIGLPYVQDPRISCQLAKFLSMTGESETAGMDQFIMPTAVLFNGGTLKAAALRKQLMALLNRWAKELKKPAVQELPDADYDYAVSRGAVYYGVARLGQAIRIRGGTSRSYFVGVEEAAPAVPGISPPLRAICIVPFGMEEGEERELDNQEFALILGEQATFRFFSHATPKLSNGVEPEAGTIVRNWKQELTELHPIETLLDKKEGDGKTTRVKLKAKVTELGVLELWCVAPDERKWKLEFDTREDRSLAAKP
ncbi:putative chaperone protein dnaK [Candidatus Protochlamydia naegleriophila]|uniref:Putative chaperone protein dnaK n=1 Tax=Candidatus Protochlamydia naegleriophila TaxID=389348 RepID=A0A0U5JFE8_9BACT|nr:Hsp70 family protein [Candidatus Protochlamydia naegleriophila]CUI17330.1 putative chaperone protein dnaK [Candidatus Protochlamydia naegleriophila]